MRTFSVIASYTLRKLMRRRRVIGLSLLMVLPAIIIAAVGKNAGDPEQLSEGLTVAVLLAVAIPVVALVNASAALGDDRREHLLPFLTLKPVPRSVIVVAALAGSMVATLALGGVGIVALWLATGVVAGVWVIWPAAVALVILTLAYTTVFVPISYVFRRGTLIGLIYIFLWEAVLASAVTTLAASSLWRIGLAAYLGLLESPVEEMLDLLGTVEPDVGVAFAKVGVLVVLSLATTTWLLRSRDQVV